MRGLVSSAFLALGACNPAFGLIETQLVDSRPDGFVCSHGKPFGAGARVPIDPAYSVESARFNRERAVAYLSLCPAGVSKDQCDLYLSPFTRETDSFVSYVKLTGVSAANVYDAYPTITPGGTHLLFGSNRGGGGTHIWSAAAVASSFDLPMISQPAITPPGTTSTNEPYILGDGRTLYYSAMTASFDWSLYRTVGEPPNFGTPELVPGLDLSPTDVAAVVSDDELEMFFASNRKDVGLGFAVDIWTTTRPSVGVPFGAPVMIDAISTPGTNNDWPVWISPDACELYYINKEDGLATLRVSRR